MRKLLTIIFLFGATFAQAPEKVSPDVYKVVFENENVKVLEVIFEPGQSDKMHRHNRMVYYVIKGGTMQITSSDGTVNVAEIKEGSSAQQDPVVHRVKNIGKTRAKLIVVEEK